MEDLEDNEVGLGGEEDFVKEKVEEFVKDIISYGSDGEF